MDKPVFSPDVFIKTRIINFAITQKGVEESLLNHIIKIDLKELDTYFKDINSKIV